MPDEPERDNTTLTVGHFAKSSAKNIAKVVFFYIFLVLFKVLLIAAIRINRVTVMHFEFHCGAIELLHHTTALLTMKDAR